MDNLIVRCANYNGSKDVLFRMRSNDFRLSDDDLKGNWTIIESARVIDPRTIIGCDSGIVYQVFSDWSIALKSQATTQIKTVVTSKFVVERVAVMLHKFGADAIAHALETEFSNYGLNTAFMVAYRAQDAPRRIAVLDKDENARWVRLFTDRVTSGEAEDIADYLTFRQMQIEFPRLKDFDAISDATHI